MSLLSSQLLLAGTPPRFGSLTVGEWNSEDRPALQSRNTARVNSPTPASTNVSELETKRGSREG